MNSPRILSTLSLETKNQSQGQDLVSSSWMVEEAAKNKTRKPIRAKNSNYYFSRYRVSNLLSLFVIFSCKKRERKRRIGQMTQTSTNDDDDDTNNYSIKWIPLNDETKKIPQWLQTLLRLLLSVQPLRHF